MFVLRSPEPKKGLTFMFCEPKASTVTTKLIYLKIYARPVIKAKIDGPEVIFF